jgi:hypothetical protein
VSPRTRGLRTVVTLAALAAAQTAAAIEQAPAGAFPAARQDTLGEVTITAQRELARKVSKFVDQIAARENAEGLPRWNEPVCPLVTGLPKQDGELVLTRISEAARAAEVPLAGEQCRPNLYVIVLADPKRALASMGLKKRTRIFGQANESVVRHFIDTPRPVRVWYNSGMSDPSGMLPNVSQYSIDVFDPFAGYPLFEHTLPTHLSFNRIWSFSSVVLIVDKARLSTVSPGQLAGYAAMVGLAEIRPEAQLDGAQTILRVFDPAPDTAPVDMTAWDQGFLKSLYATPQKSTEQRTEIAHAMARVLSH